MTFLEKVESYTSLVDKEIFKLLKDEPKELYEPIEYHFKAGGKRVRPALCMLACEAISGDYKTAIPIATSLELVHSFSLLHDDVMDRDDMRRGRETVHHKWSDAVAINAGDGIYTLAYKSLLNLDLDDSIKTRTVGVLTEAILEVCEGQSLDLGFEKRDAISVKDYYSMSSRKTGALIRAATETGAIAGQGTEEQIKALREYGSLIGLAFQVWDDYIDFSSKKTGKTFGSDIKRGKKTSIVSHALDNASESDREELLKVLNAPSDKTTPEMIQSAVAILSKTGSIEFAKDESIRWVVEAKEKLSVLEDSEAKKLLEEFADFIVSRDV